MDDRVRRCPTPDPATRSQHLAPSVGRTSTQSCSAEMYERNGLRDPRGKRLRASPRTGRFRLARGMLLFGVPMQTQTKLRSTLETSMIGLSLCAMLAAMTPTSASAAEVHVGDARVTALEMVYRDSQIVRERSPGKDAVKFSAMDAEIDESAVVVFEVQSESADKRVTRWRCVAERNVSECFASPLRVKYLDDDVRLVMNVRVEAARTDVPAYARR